MALTSTVHVFDIDLADQDRHVYESLALRVARHPSESAEYFVTRVVAYCLEYTDGIAFSSGLSDPEEPTISVRDLAGTIRTWVEIGTPDAARLHKASKAAARVAVYVHKDPEQWLRQLEGARIHRASDIAAFAVDRPLVAALAEHLERRMTWTVSVADGHVLVADAARTVEGDLTRLTLPAA